MDHHLKSPSERTSFRYAAISLVKARIGSGASPAQAIAETVELLKQGPRTFGISRASVYRWLRDFESQGFAGLQDPQVTREHTALSEDFLAFLKSEKDKDPDASIPELIRRAEALDIIDAKDTLDRSTVYRHARRLNLPLPRKKKRDSTKKPFAYSHRMQMVLCDGKHFRAGAERLKRVAYIFLDDATRYILGVVVGTSENSALFLKGLFSVISQHGLMDAIYLDNGPGFVADDVQRVAQNLDIPFIFGTVRYPEGHGKIERFNQTLKSQCLRGLDKPEIDPTLSALRVRLEHFTTQVYAATKHDTLKTCPQDLFFNDSKRLRFPEDAEKFRRCFTLTLRRKVREDNCISHNGVIYEVPLGYASTTVTLYHDLLQDEISIFHKDRLVKLAPPDLVMNARDGVMRRPHQKKETAKSHVETAAEVRFRKDIRSIVNPDGGYISPID